jgi:hypothetical protein
MDRDRDYDRDRDNDRGGDWSGYENREFGTGRFGQDVADRYSDRSRGNRAPDQRQRSSGDRYDYRGSGGSSRGSFGSDRQPRGGSPDGFIIYEEYDIWPTSNHEHYRRWRDREMQSLDRDYDLYCRERQQGFEQDFGEWRRNRSQSTQGDDQRGQSSTGQTSGDAASVGTGATTATGSTAQGGTTGTSRTSRTSDKDRQKETTGASRTNSSK